jgi:hypothetical protein
VLLEGDHALVDAAWDSDSRRLVQGAHPGKETLVTEPIDVHDARRRRCPMLGHDLDFSYCREPGSPTPCRKIFDCWWETFDVVAFIGRHYSKEGMGRILAPPPQKMSTLADLVRKARRGG